MTRIRVGDRANLDSRRSTAYDPNLCRLELDNVRVNGASRNPWLLGRRCKMMKWHRV